MKRIQVDNIMWVIENYGEGLLKGDLTLGVDEHTELNGADLVVYDIEGAYGVSSQSELRLMLDYTGGDEEVYEVDRVTLVRIDDF